MMQDAMATFYGGYDQVRSIQPSRVHISTKVMAVGVAALVLVVFITADVSAFETRPAVVQVTVVNWDVENSLLTTSAGFTLHGSQTVTLSLTCSTVCFRFNGAATVSSPFTLLGFTVAYAPIQYANATVQAPSSGYSGPMTIDLGVG